MWALELTPEEYGHQSAPSAPGMIPAYAPAFEYDYRDIFKYTGKRHCTQCESRLLQTIIFPDSV